MRREVYVAVRTEGSLLPADLLQRIAAGDPELDGLRPDDYHLPPRDRLREAMNRSWTRLQNYWSGFKRLLAETPAHDPATGLTRERWLHPLLQELGYGRLPASREHVRVGDREYPVSHFYGHVPIHLIGARIKLDDRTRGVAGAARMSPHGLVQDLLNRSDDHLWGMVSNGLRLRLLRDNTSLTRQAYVEFDLEAIMEGQLYSDFVLLWLLCHQSRLESERPEECWLERWCQTAHEQGTRALDTLRDGVEKALTLLGTGFLKHPGNRELRTKLETGTLDSTAYYRQLLRLVYRLLFLFVAEARDLLLKPDADPRAQERYIHYYSVTRLRTLAEKTRGGRTEDLYRGLRVVFEKLADGGYEPLGLPALGNGLFDPRETPDLAEADITNADLLEAIRALAFLQTDKRRRPVDYRNLRSEELGSVYEALLELVPVVNIHEPAFRLQAAAGNERKTTGSYYTPDDLVQCLLDTALEPVVTARLEEAKTLSARTWQQLKPNQRYLWERVVTQAQGHVPEASAPGATAASTDQDGRGEDGLEGGISPLRLATLWNNPAELLGSTRQAPLSPQSARYLLLAEHLLLSLRICDPAVGSGHFLIGAAHRVARRLAKVRVGDDEPSPEVLRTALREVVRRCLYGVDVNPMAVDLCKLALWMESMEPGKPLSFLDHHIKCGNSLIGATRELMDKGIPPEAYEPIEGDDRTYCARLRKMNEQDRRGILRLFNPSAAPWERLGDLAAAVAKISHEPEDTPEAVEAHRQRYAEALRSEDYENNWLVADLWCAAFFWKKVDDAKGQAPTTIVLRQAVRNPHEVPDWMKPEARRLAAEYRFFHWQLAFPEVFPPKAGSAASTRQGGGFDIVLGNPPWERVKLQEKEWFASRVPEIARARNKAERERLIRELQKADPETHAAFREARRAAEAESRFLRSSGRFPLGGRGDVNTYAVFAELARSLLATGGHAGIIVPTGIATDDTTKHFFGDLMETGSLISLFDFENGKRPSEADRGDDEAESHGVAARPAARGAPSRLARTEQRHFPHVHGQYKFCLLTFTTPRGTDPGAPLTAQLSPLTCPTPPRFAFFCHSVADLSRPGKVFTLTADDIALLNPNTRTCPVFRSRRDAEITMAIYRKVPVLIRDDQAGGNPWGVRFLTMFHMSNDSHLFRTRQELEEAGGTLEGNRWKVPKTVSVNGKVVKEGLWLPLYEAKMIHHFDHRWATYEILTQAKGKKAAGQPATRAVTLAEKQDPNFVVMPRYWVHEREVDRAAATDRGWFLGFRDITNTTNQRTAIFAVLPRAAVGNKLPLISLGGGAHEYGLGFSCFASFVLDYGARQKIGGTSLTYFYLQQLPVPPPAAYREPCSWSPGVQIRAWLAPRVLELTYTAHDLEPFARDMGYDGPPFRWDEERRFLLRCELDAAFFHLYGVERDDVDYIMETFPIVRKKDLAAHGRYRTKETILEIYDALHRAMDIGEPYQTPLDPPPALGWTPPADAFVQVPHDGEEAEPEQPAGTETPPPVAPPAEPATLELVSPPVVSLRPGDRVLVNGKPATLVREPRPFKGARMYEVRMDGERRIRRFVNPPASIEKAS